MSPKKILVADDDEQLRFALSLSLKMAGFEVETAGNGREALDKALGSIEGGRPFDLLITDIIMPEMNGLELVEKLNHARLGIPILVLSAYARDKDITYPLSREGVAYLLEKPFNMQEMIHLVNLLSKNAAPNDGEMRILIVDDCKDICLLIEKLLRREGYEKTDAAENGSEALEKIMAAERAGEGYSLVITDLEMPVMGGLELIRSIQDRKYAIPILVISGKEEAELGERLMDNGAWGFLRKPVDSRRFNETVRGILYSSKEKGGYSDG